MNVLNFDCKFSDGGFITLILYIYRPKLEMHTILCKRLLLTS